MRYLSSIVISTPIFLIAVIWGAAGTPLRLTIPTLLISTFLGIALGRYMSRIQIRHLMSGDTMSGDTHFLLRPFPGGMWFVVGMGVIGGLSPLPIFAFFGRSMGWLILHTAAVIFGALIGAAFATVGVSIWHIERAEGRHVLMWPDGIFFDSE